MEMKFVEKENSVSSKNEKFSFVNFLRKQKVFHLAKILCSDISYANQLSTEEVLFDILIYVILELFI